MDLFTRKTVATFIATAKSKHSTRFNLFVETLNGERKKLLQQFKDDTNAFNLSSIKQLEQQFAECCQQIYDELI